MSSGIIFALLTALSWSIGLFPFTQAARRLGSHSLNHFRLLVAMVVVGLFCIAFTPTEFLKLFTPSYLQAWIWLGLSGIVGLTIGDYFAFAMYSILGARVGSVLSTFAPAAALLLGWIMVDEHISFVGIIGIAITIVGVNFISLGKKERVLLPEQQHKHITKGIFLGVLAALCQGAGLVMAKKGMMLEKEIGITVIPFHATFIRMTIAVVSVFLLTAFQGRLKEIASPILKNREGGIKYALAGSLFGPILGVSLSLYTISIMDPSIAQTIFSLVPAITLFLAYFFLREKITWQSLLGVVVAVAGVVVLIWRDRVQF